MTPSEAARQAWQAGLCPVPAARDGTKKPFGQWKQYQTTRPTLAQVDAWFANGHPGWGVICGAVSGQLEMLEFEGRAVAEGMWEQFLKRCDDAGLADVVDRIFDGYAENTPSKGLHLLMQVDGIANGNLKLARRLDAFGDPEVLIETRGEGGFTILAPSNGSTHPTGKAWKAIPPGSLSTIATVTVAERDAIYAVAKSFDAMPAPTIKTQPATFRPFTPTGESWIDELCQELKRTPWSALLARYNIQHHHDSGDVSYWTRPGKDNRLGHSATTNAKGTDRLIVFTSAMPLEPWDGTGPAPSYDRLDVIAAYEHGKDRIAAARALRGPRDNGHTRPSNVDPETGEIIADRTRVLPDEFWQARPILAHIRQAALSKMISPDGVLGSVLVRTVALSHHTVTLPAVVGREGCPDLFVANVALPSIGKGASMDIAAKLQPPPTVFGSWLAGRFIEAPVGSGEGIVKLFFGTVIETDPDGKQVKVQKQVAFNALLRIDEAETLERLAKRQDQTTMTVLRSAWSRETLGAAYSDVEKDRRIPAGQYRLGIVMGVQPAMGGFLLDDHGTGTPQRFMFVTGAHPDIDEHNVPDWPGPLCWKAVRPVDNNEMEVATPICTELRARHAANVRGENTSVFQAHSGLLQLKIAAGLAMLDSRANITAEDWQLSAMLAATSNAVRDGLRADLERERNLAAQAQDERAGRRRLSELKAEEQVANQRIAQGAQVLRNRLLKVGTPMLWRDLRDCLGRYKSDAVAIREHASENGLISMTSEGLWTATQ